MAIQLSAPSCLPSVVGPQCHFSCSSTKDLLTSDSNVLIWITAGNKIGRHIDQHIQCATRHIGQVGVTQRMTSIAHEWVCVTSDNSVRRHTDTRSLGVRRYIVQYHPQRLTSNAAKPTPTVRFSQVPLRAVDGRGNPKGWWCSPEYPLIGVSPSSESLPHPPLWVLIVASPLTSCGTIN